VIRNCGGNLPIEYNVMAVIFEQIMVVTATRYQQTCRDILLFVASLRCRSRCCHRSPLLLSPLGSGHDHIGIVTHAMGTGQPSRASPALAASAATLTPVGNGSLGAVLPCHFDRIGTCATFGGA
jgi:hypothetical protein